MLTEEEEQSMNVSRQKDTEEQEVLSSETMTVLSYLDKTAARFVSEERLWVRLGKTAVVLDLSKQILVVMCNKSYERMRDQNHVSLRRL